ncbi:hypothetical protein C8J57DRAFT_1336063 [Mycena rebaudengoi]|nr:hypothetical protein C8J57DRAFT_1336063 [Mycena rebaudengoi]
MPLLSALKKGTKIAGVCLALLLCGPCFLCLKLLGFRWKKPNKCGWVEEIPLPDPDPLPIDRIDIGQTKITPQAEACHLLSLPLELRQLIFETALGLRVLSLWLDADPAYDYQRLLVRVKRDSVLPVALLRTCRQVYLEALPILHQRNTFRFDTESAPGIILGGLGLYSLPNIRSVEVEFYDGAGDTRFTAACRLLEAAGLESVTLLFVPPPFLNDRDFGMESGWCRSLLRIRGLRRLVLLCDYPNPAGGVEQEADEFAFTRRKWILQDEEKVRKAMVELCALMIGPEADARYSAFLEAQKLREQNQLQDTAASEL